MPNVLRHDLPNTFRDQFSDQWPGPGAGLRQPRAALPPSPYASSRGRIHGIEGIIEGIHDVHDSAAAGGRAVRRRAEGWRTVTAGACGGGRGGRGATTTRPASCRVSDPRRTVGVGDAGSPAPDPAHGAEAGAGGPGGGRALAVVASAPLWSGAQDARRARRGPGGGGGPGGPAFLVGAAEVGPGSADGEGGGGGSAVVTTLCGGRGDGDGPCGGRRGRQGQAARGAAARRRDRGWPTRCVRRGRRAGRGHDRAEPGAGTDGRRTGGGGRTGPARCGRADGGPARPAEPIGLNTATAEQLDTLPGVGPVLARHILDYRTEHGGFRSVDELREVNGIGDRRFADLRPLVRP